MEGATRRRQDTITKAVNGRYQHLLRAGKVKQQATTAVGRELAGFIMAITCEVMGKPHGSRATA